MIVSFFGGTIPILSRKLKDTPPTLMMFFLGLAGSIIMLLFVVIEALLSEDKSLRMLQYTGKQMLLILTSTVFSFIATTSYTIAYQSDSSSFIILIGNVGIIYFFLSDTLIFNEVFSLVELLAIFVIAVVVLTVALIKLRQKKNHT